MKRWITALAVLMMPLASAMARPSNISDQHPQGINVSFPEQNHEICWVGDVPPGFGVQTLQVSITNETLSSSDRQKGRSPQLPLMLTLNSSPIYVMRRASSGEAHLPHGMVVEIGGVEYLETVLYPGWTCHVTPLPTHNDRYTVTGTKVEAGNMVNRWMPIAGPEGIMGYKNVNGGSVRITTRCEEKSLHYSNRALDVVFDAGDRYDEC
jgi:hypothetical protein